MRRKLEQDRQTRVVTLRLTEDDYLWLKAAALVTDRSMNEAAVQAFRFAREWEEGQIMTSEQAALVSQTVERWRMQKGGGESEV